jgi:high affinity sulfate transporter 1
VIGLIDFDAAYLIWKIDKFDFVACMGAFFGVVFASVEIGLLIAVRIMIPAS